MSIDGLIFWAFVLGWVVVIDLIVVHALHALRDGKRIVVRVSAFGGVPIAADIDRARRDLMRLQRARDTVPNLIERARVSCAQISAIVRLRR